MTLILALSVLNTTMIRRLNAGTLTFDVSEDVNDTNVLLAEGNYKNCDVIVFSSPEDAFTGNISIAVSFDGTNYIAIEEITRGTAGIPGAPVPLALTSIAVQNMGWTHMKCQSDASEGDDADINVVGLEYYT